MQSFEFAEVAGSVLSRSRLPKRWEVSALQTAGVQSAVFLSRANEISEVVQLAGQKLLVKTFLG